MFSPFYKYLSPTVRVRRYIGGGRVSRAPNRITRCPNKADYVIQAALAIRWCAPCCCTLAGENPVTRISSTRNKFVPILSFTYVPATRFRKRDPRVITERERHESRSDEDKTGKKKKKKRERKKETPLFLFPIRSHNAHFRGIGRAPHRSLARSREAGGE